MSLWVVNLVLFILIITYEGPDVDELSNMTPI